MEPQIALTTPLLEGTDGNKKMSKSLGNYIGVTESPHEMFGKAMSIPDGLMHKYFELATDMPASEIEPLLDVRHTHPRTAKVILAKTLFDGIMIKRPQRPLPLNLTAFSRNMPFPT